jgi:hypothetical protein
LAALLSFLARIFGKGSEFLMKRICPGLKMRPTMVK